MERVRAVILAKKEEIETDLPEDLQAYEDIRINEAEFMSSYLAESHSSKVRENFAFLIQNVIRMNS